LEFSDVESCTSWGADEPQRARQRETRDPMANAHFSRTASLGFQVLPTTVFA
jgi:hypothetical protein